MAVDVVVLVAVSVVVGFICFVASISTPQEIEVVFFSILPKILCQIQTRLTIV